jgi:hypothetical protein
MGHFFIRKICSTPASQLLFWFEIFGKDPTMTREELLHTLRAEALLGTLYQNPIQMIYSGYGDSGGMIETQVFKDVLDKADLKKRKLQQAIEELLHEVMWSEHGGYENGDGGEGTITWDLATDKILIEHRQAHMEYEESSSEH